MKYIIIEQNLFQAHSGLKNFGNPQGAHYMEDNVNTIVLLKFKNDNKDYYLLHWDNSKGTPEGILPRYSENGNNPKVNKIMTGEEVRKYIVENQEDVL